MIFIVDPLKKKKKLFLLCFICQIVMACLLNFYIMNNLNLLLIFYIKEYKEMGILPSNIVCMEIIK